MLSLKPFAYIMSLALCGLPFLYGDQILQGEWLPTQTSKGGLGMMKIYKEKNDLEVVQAAIIKTTYKTTDNTLTLRPDQEDKDLQFSFQLSNQDLLLIESKSLKETHLKKDHGQSDSLLGKWSGESSYGGEQNYYFDDQQNCFIVIRIRPMKGSYELSDSDLIESIGKRKHAWEWQEKKWHAHPNIQGA